MEDKRCAVCNEPVGKHSRAYCGRACSYVAMGSVRVLRGNPSRTASTVRVRDMIQMGRFLSDNEGEWLTGAVIASQVKLSANRINKPLKIYFSSDFLEVSKSIDNAGTTFYRAKRGADTLVDMVGEETVSKAQALFK